MKTKIVNVNACIEEIVGLKKEQFTQIAMIAQGDFLRLLHAKTRDRQDIFRDIFNTGLYRTFQERLSHEAEDLKRKRAAVNAGVRQYISGILCGEDSVYAPEVVRAKEDGMLTDEILSLLDKLIDEQKSRALSIKGRIEENDRKLDAITVIVAKAQEQEKTRKELLDAKAEFSAMQPVLEALKAEREAAQKRLPEAEELSAQLARVQVELPDYDLLEEKAAAAEKARKEHEAAAAARDKAQNALDASKTALEALREEQASLSKAGEERARLLQEQEKARTRSDALTALRAELAQLKKQEKKFDRAKAEYIAAAGAADELRNKAAALRTAFNNEQAGIMAEHLTEGQPCPVCGSRSHPLKAVKSTDAPTQAQVETAEEEANTAQKQANSKSAAAAELRGQLDSSAEAARKKTLELLQGRESDDPDREAERQLEQLNAVLAALKSSIANEDKRVLRKQQLDEIIPRREGELNTVSEAIVAHKENVSALEARVAELIARRGEIAAGLRFESRELALAEAKKLTEQCAAIRNAAAAAESRFVEKDRQSAALAARAEQLEKLIAESETVDIEARQEEKHQLTEIKKQLTDRMEQAQHILNANESTRASILLKADELIAIDRRYVWLKNLSDTANGTLTGKDKITLETYVQMAYFDRIIRRANLHLMKMSGGKYDLKRKEDKDKHNSLNGLELDVIDHYNGSERSVKSLSGGESFIASLSLALGLSEEIQASAGGVRLDAMFVDEGFGSLDEDTLRTAMQALRSLTDSNRIVGIISHVADLRREIERQVVVRKARDGGSFVTIEE